MVGKKITLTYQEKTSADDGQGGFTNTWRDIRDFRGNFDENYKNGLLEQFINDKNQNEIIYMFITDYSLRTTIRNDGRFYHSSTNIYYEIVNAENVGLQNVHWEIKLKKVI